MNSEEFNAVERQRQELLGQLTAAETALRTGLQAQGFGSTAHAHMERALAHIQEARIALNEINRARTVGQLVNDLVRLQLAMDEARRGKIHHL